MKQSEMTSAAKALFLEGVTAADPAFAVKQALSERPIEATPNGRLLVLAFGKAACAMMEAALESLPEGQSATAIAVTNYENARDIKGCKVFASGHPLPDQNGLDAGLYVMEGLERLTANDAVLCLISGGGSALLPTPRDGLTLADKIAVNEALLSGGLDIVQMNAVRQQLSILKGGGLLDLAHPAKVRSLVISDVIGDDIRAIASGPTAQAMGGLDQIIPVLKAKSIWEDLPAAAQSHLSNPRNIRERESDNSIICSNRQSLTAIQKIATDWDAHIVSDRLVGDVEQAARDIVDYALSHPVKSGDLQLLIWGGETTVNLRGTGKGGRNQELCLHVASLAQDLPEAWVFLSGGTDGRDGPTDAAGGIVDSATLQRARSKGVNVEDALSNNDSYRILQAAGNLLLTKATGTNVADIQLLLRMG